MAGKGAGTRKDAADLLPDVLAALDAGRVAPVYHLSGEPYAVEAVVAAIKRVVLPGGESAFNHDVLLAGEAGVGGILDAARTMPMFGPRRLVLVRDVHVLVADDLSRLLPYVQDPAPSSCLVLLAEKADLRLKFFAELKKTTAVLARFEPLKDRQAAAWVVAEARRQRVELKPGAAESIADAVGTDMAQLASALERLALYVGPGKAVATADVEELLARTRQRSIFELTNAVGRGQRREALLVLRQMLADREPGVRIVAMLARHVRQLWSARELARRGQGRNEIATTLGIHPFFVGDVLQQAQRFGEDALRRTHRALFEADRSLKSSRLSDGQILERLVLTLCPAEGIQR